MIGTQPALPGAAGVDSDPDGIAPFLRAYYSALETLDPDTIGAFWEQSAEALFRADDNAAWLAGWTAIASYCEARCAALTARKARLGALTIYPLSRMVSGAVYPVTWELMPIGTPAPVVARVVASVVLRRTPAGWRLVQYAETPPGAPRTAAPSTNSG